MRFHVDSRTVIIIKFRVKSLIFLYVSLGFIMLALAQAHRVGSMYIEPTLTLARKHAMFHKLVFLKPRIFLPEAEIKRVYFQVEHSLSTARPPLASLSRSNYSEKVISLLFFLKLS